MQGSAMDLELGSEDEQAVSDTHKVLKAKVLNFLQEEKITKE